MIDRAADAHVRVETEIHGIASLSPKSFSHAFFAD
jgi:hypothetical protein